MKWALQMHASLLLLFGAVFLMLTAAVLQGGTFLTDQAMLHRVHAHASPLLDRLAVLLTALGGLGGMIPLALVIARLAFAWRSRRAAAGVLVCVGGAYLLSVVCKLLVQRERPHLWAVLTPETDFSYPSGHALLSLSTVVTLVWIVWHTPTRVLTLSLGGLFVLLVGLSRVYLGVHYPSDVLAGWLLAGLWCTAVSWMIAILKKRQ